jgi:hypothetical protein
MPKMHQNELKESVTISVTYFERNYKQLIYKRFQGSNCSQRDHEKIIKSRYQLIFEYLQRSSPTPRKTSLFTLHPHTHPSRPANNWNATLQLASCSTPVVLLSALCEVSQFLVNPLYPTHFQYRHYE